jgi:hypothetical protein
MEQVMAQYWRSLMVSIERARERKLTRDAQRYMGACSCESDGCTDADRLESIAVYARAGYFTADAVQLSGEAPLH